MINFNPIRFGDTEEVRQKILRKSKTNGFLLQRLLLFTWGQKGPDAVNTEEAFHNQVDSIIGQKLTRTMSVKPQYLSGN